MAAPNRPARRRVLLVVEGDRVEPRLMERCFDLLNLKDVPYEIVSFCTNIYQFIKYIDRNYEGDFESIEVEKVLGEIHPEQADVLGGGFTDIVLVFDYDPQDSDFDQARLEEMAACFNESSNLGKLYLNYPSVEALRDFSGYGDRAFYDSAVSREDLAGHGYKRMVESRRPHPPFTDFRRISAPDLVNIIAMNVGKIQHLLGPMPIEATISWARRPNLTEESRSLDLEEFLCLQGKELDRGRVYICGTCLFFFLENWGTVVIDPIWRKASA